ncbi:MAG: glutamate--tRNA ligase family protein, partial [Candidatus Micrarchaeota archaeon]
MDAQIVEAARKHALANAIEFGKASAGAVAGKVIAEVPSAKGDIRATMKGVGEQVAAVNKLSRGEMLAQVKEYSFVEKPAEGERKLSLQGCEEGKVVTRFPPEPNGYPHIGHAKAAWLNRQLANDWGGTCILRFDDTNPEAEREEFANAILYDLKWLGIEFDGEVVYASDLMPEFYNRCEQLLAAGGAYACSCGEEAVKLSREKGVACNCRSRSAKENLGVWGAMREGRTAKGGAIIRFKGDLKSANTAMRDPTLFRVLDAAHWRQGTKFKAWPTYDFEAAVADSVTGVTHALRSKEYELRDELYAALLECLGMRKPVVYGFSRLALKGTALSKRLVKPLIETGRVSGWDDVRLPTIAGLRRRGILPQVIREFVLSFGLSKVESRPDWEALLSLNRKALDPVA